KDRQYRLVEGEPIQFIVACETDYNRDGVIEGDTELRVPIGEVFEDTDVSMLNVFLGHPSFSEEPVEDRWGVWMSAYAPIFGPTGEVEAAVGVDFDANEWVASIHRARSTMLAYAGLIVLALTGGVTIASNQLTSQAAAREREVGELTRKAKEKFEALVNSIEGVVFERDPRTNSLTFVSEQAERILGRPAGDWMKEPGSWEANLHPDDRDETARRCKESGQTRSTYSIEYRMLRPGGEVVWIRETGSPVIDEQGDISATRGVLSDVSDQKKAAEELEQTHRKLVETSRQAGMAEVATGVLHNVGNVLNSVNVASTLIRQRLNGSRLGTLGQLASLLQSQGERLPDFFRGDERGRLVPDYLEKLSHHLRQEQTEVLAEVEKLVKNVEHIKTIVDLQQSYARTGGAMEPVDLVALIEDAIGINQAAIARHRIQIIRSFDDSVPEVLADRNKVLQILVNLLRNAKHAIDDCDREERFLGVSVKRQGKDKVRVTVADTGVGIAPENLPKLFTHGFTTRRHGHGFGLHSSEAAAREMGGSL
ncbi:MAG: PAS domain-containing protein, partial [Verrucomicrobiae bacterium]|nr:PAS domain-containing protein [Verrucomicrobiae bacterium]